MEFSRVGQHTIKCVISEEEIIELGFSMDEIMGNGERTQAFMNQIFDMAEKEFETKFDMGIKTVRADFLPDHTLSLTFSEHPGAGGMVEHLKDIVNGLLNSIPSEKWEVLLHINTSQAKICCIFLCRLRLELLLHSWQVVLESGRKGGGDAKNTSRYLYCRY